ncbi:MAG: Hsp20/alpha crystallin family protein [Bacteroidia bacterium]
MSIVRWNKPLNGIEKHDIFMPTFENLFNNFFSNDLLTRDYAGYVPSVNIIEKPEAFILELSAPGFEKSDFSIKVEEGKLVISGEHKVEKSVENGNYVRKEFNYGSFSRVFEIKDLINEHEIKANYENGILKVDLPKIQKSNISNVREIKIS